MSRVERLARGVDGFQQRHRPLAFLYGVVKKFGDDRAGTLAALLVYYALLSLFPALLILVTVLGLVASSDPSIERDIVNSALKQFPVIGEQLRSNVHALERGSGPGLTIGLLWLVWSSIGISQAGQHAMAEVWNIRGVRRPGYWARLVRSGLFIGLVAIFLVVSTGLSWVASYPIQGVGEAWRVGGGLVSAVVNVATYLVAFRVLTPNVVRTRQLVPGAIAAGLAWTVLQTIGSYLVGRYVRDATPVYGFFAIILGLIFWIYLGAQVTLYCAELNVVVARRWWPRGLVQPPLTRADKEVLVAMAKEEERFKEEQVDVHFAEPAGDPAPRQE
ncbi:MAG TPA: YihY/virulence factor BrkB family protein [Acidimicrobiales bacterium]|nr:YihY/virulence factor BrkB family protein [Acidimicrobiales bacterium]